MGGFQVAAIWLRVPQSPIALQKVAEKLANFYTAALSLGGRTSTRAGPGTKSFGMGLSGGLVGPSFNLMPTGLRTVAV